MNKHQRDGDFVPIIECCGDVGKCDMRGKRFVLDYKRCLSIRAINARKKAAVAEKALAEIEAMTG